MGLATSVVTPGVHLRTRTKQLGANKKAEVRCEVFHCQEESRLSEEFHEDWCEEVAEDGLGPCESVGRTSRWHRAHRKAEVEEVDGSCSRAGVVGLAVSFHGVE